MEEFIYKNNKPLKFGYTTGTCAAAASQRAAAILLGANFSQEDQIILTAPKGFCLRIPAAESKKEESWASCAVRKDSGDDPDVTNGILVYSKVSKVERTGEYQIKISGGIGVGRVTKAGLSCPVGEAAINPVPRKMIEDQVRKICEEFDYHGGLEVEISIPEGVEIAKRTFNPRLGIEGGISILGTSGIVEPMSDQAIIDTVKVEMDVRKAAGAEYLVITPGNYGETFLKNEMNINKLYTVKCSNFVGDALDYAERLKFKGVLLVGHIGKFVKLSAGIMNTHSKFGDARMELIAAHAALAGSDVKVTGKLFGCITADDAISVLDEAEIRERTIQSILSKIDFHIKERTHRSLETGAVIFSNKYGYLGQTADAELLLKNITE